MSYLAENCNLGIEEQLAVNFSVFPVPSRNQVFAQVNNTNITAYSVTDLSGRVIMESSNLELPVLILDGAQLNAGKYLLSVQTPFGIAQKSFVIE
jgi:hypothetical protein